MGGEDKRRRFRTGGSKVSSTGVEGLGRVQSRLFGGLQSSLLGASQLLLVLLGVFIENINTPIACDTEKHILPIHAAEQCL